MDILDRIEEETAYIEGDHGIYTVPANLLDAAVQSGFASCVSVLDVPIKANNKLKSICHHSVADAFHFGLLANTMLRSSR